VELTNHLELNPTARISLKLFCSKILSYGYLDAEKKDLNDMREYFIGGYVKSKEKTR
jgi:hypothetical protein